MARRADPAPQASTTVATVFVTFLLMCCHRLGPITLIITDSFLAIMWTASLALLLKAMGATTTQTCSLAAWGNADGVRVCHLFKVLVAFAALSLGAGMAVIAVAATARKGEGKHKYEPATNPVVLRSADTSYNPASVVYGAHNPPPTYGAPAPAVYGTPATKAYKDGGKPEKQPAGEAGEYYA